MASVPLLMVSGFFLVVGILLATFSLGEGFVVVLIGLAFLGGGLLWGFEPAAGFSDVVGEDRCPQCGQPNAADGIFCSGCGFYLPLPA